MNFIENHDQLANSGNGSRLRLRTSPGRYRAMTAVLLLMPGTPMLFQGQEFGASTPFLYFADHSPDLARAVQKGRIEFCAQFQSLASPEMRERAPAPHDRGDVRAQPPGLARVEHARRGSAACTRDLLALRRADRAFNQQAPGAVDGAVLAPEAFVLRYIDARRRGRAAPAGEHGT